MYVEVAKNYNNMATVHIVGFDQFMLCKNCLLFYNSLMLQVLPIIQAGLQNSPYYACINYALDKIHDNTQLIIMQ